MAFCKKCGHELGEGDLFCSHCGKKVDEEVSSDNPNLYPCPSCGHTVSKMATSCPSCGHPLNIQDGLIKVMVSRSAIFLRPVPIFRIIEADTNKILAEANVGQVMTFQIDKDTRVKVQQGSQTFANVFVLPYSGSHKFVIKGIGFWGVPGLVEVDIFDS